MSSYFDDKELFVGPQTHQYGSHMVTTDVKKPIQTKYIKLIDGLIRNTILT